MRHTLKAPLLLAIALATGALVSGLLIVWNASYGTKATPLALTYRTYLHSGTLISKEKDLLLLTASYPGAPKDIAPMAIRYGHNTMFVRHTPKVEDGKWIGIDVSRETPEGLTDGDYLYITYIYDAEDRYVATNVIVGNPLIQ